MRKIPIIAQRRQEDAIFFEDKAAATNLLLEPLDRRRALPLTGVKAASPLTAGHAFG
ncbi:hypothetical protein [uncultured Desulfovibrio sp.]|uniref:hypothetical protein n=1 Tax=uncultured Desulfovibrio sp. TaxID=167968 RepID=UPI00266BE51B|nr:hypothetical protein [uncultured Desulfovibrio sp.]